jgi:hypothetical protein
VIFLEAERLMLIEAQRTRRLFEGTGRLSENEIVFSRSSRKSRTLSDGITTTGIHGSISKSCPL